MPESYDYGSLTDHPRLVAVYSGWTGQKLGAMAQAAVISNRSDIWLAACPEANRLVLMLHAAKEADLIEFSRDTRAAIGTLIRHFSDGGWWASSEGMHERTACQDERQQLDQFPDDETDLGGTLPSPLLALEDAVTYPVASTVLSSVSGALRQAAAAMGELDACRLGVMLSAFCHRCSPRLKIGFVNSTLDDLAAYGMTDLDAENEFRRAVRMSQVGPDRRPRSISHPTIEPPPLPLPKEHTGPARDRNPFDPTFGSLIDHRDRLLACVFRRFDVVIPPAESDASQHPALAEAKEEFLAAPAAPSENTEATGNQRREELTKLTQFWSDEAIEYLGLDRNNLKRPDMALQRLIKIGVLRPTKIGRRNVFKKADLDRILEKGGPGPPKGKTQERPEIITILRRFCGE